MRGRIAAVAVVVLGLVAAHASAQTGASGDHWVGTWATAAVLSPSQPSAQPQPLQTGPPPAFKDQTLRQIVRVSLGGDRLRVVLTNVFGTRPLTIGGAHVAVRQQGAAIVAGSNRPLTFGGLSTATIPAGAVLVSDPVSLSIRPQSDVAIDLYIPGDTAASSSPLSLHLASRQTTYVSSAGNHLGAAELPGATPRQSWYFLGRLEVSAPSQVGAVVAFGDSITDGFNSTPDTNNRWPDHLASRLFAAGSPFGILNLGIDGNRVLADGAGVSALARFDRDALVQPGVTHVFVLEGVNDLGFPGITMEGPRPTVEELIAGHRQLITRARARGLKILASTILPYEDTAFPGYWTPEGESVRKAFNEWLRTSKEYDAIVDFDAVMRDPAQPSKMLPKFDSGDHLHPNDAGYKAMAEAFDLALLGVKASAAR